MRRFLLLLANLLVSLNADISVSTGIESRRLARRCNYKPVPGCTCWSRFGRLTISCVNLDLTQIPDLGVIPDGVIVSLDLSSNAIDTVPPNAFGRIHLQQLTIRNNKAAHLDLSDQDIFRHQALYLQTLDLTNSNITDIPRSVSSLMNLQNLLLEDNKIEHLPEAPGSFYVLEKLALAGNGISHEVPEHFFTAVISLQDLSLTFSGRSLNPAWDNLLPCEDLMSLTSLTILHSDVNRFIMASQLFNANCLPNVEYFKCDNCSLHENTLQELAKNNGETFRMLALPHNSITSLGDWNSYKLPVPFQDLWYLDVSYNKITHIGSSTFSVYYPSLQYLKVNNNQIYNVAFNLYLTPLLLSVDLRYNHLTSIGFYLVDWSSKDLSIQLEGNLFHCDCHLKWVIDEIGDQVDRGMIEPPFSNPDIHRMVCATPGYLAGVALENVDASCCEGDLGLMQYNENCELHETKENATSGQGF